MVRKYKCENLPDFSVFSLVNAQKNRKLVVSQGAKLGKSDKASAGIMVL